MDNDIKNIAIGIAVYVNYNAPNAFIAIRDYLSNVTNNEIISNFKYIAELLNLITEKYRDTSSPVITRSEALELQQRLIAPLKRLKEGETLTDEMIKELFDNVDEIQSEIDKKEAEYQKSKDIEKVFYFNVFEEITKPRKRSIEAKQDVNPTASESIDQANLNEESEGNSNHLLIELLGRIEGRKGSPEDYIGDIEVKEDDSEDALTTKFNEKDYKIGDKSVVKYKKGDILNKVTADTNTNSMTISHKEGKKVKSELITDSFLATIDYMKKIGQVPFVFNINSKTPEFLKTALSFMISFTKYRSTKFTDEEVKKRNEFIKDVKAFNFNGKEVPLNSVLKCEKVDDYNKLVNSILNDDEEKNKAFEEGTKELDKRIISENDENSAPAQAPAQTPVSNDIGVSPKEMKGLWGNDGR